MPLPLPADAPTLLFRKDAFERAELNRAAFDQWLNLTPEEFRVEGSLIAVGPIYDADALQALISALEDKGLVYFDDFFEMSGNWPDWVTLLAMPGRG
jgi:hypothetical protein